MSDKRFYWLKLADTYFQEPKIKKLRRIAGGDTYTVIYLKMQLLSIRNGGILKFEGIETNFYEELALKLDEDTENVKLTLTYLQQNNLIECNDNHYLLPEAAKSIGSECDSAERVRQFRARQNNKMLPSNDKALLSNNEVTKCNKTVTLDIDIEKDIDIYSNTSVLLPRARFSSSTVEAEADTIFINLPLIGGDLFAVTESYVKTLAEMCPALDIEQQIRNMALWLDANPKQRKTKSGIKRFITGWLTREQNRARPSNGNNKRVIASNYSKEQFESVFETTSEVKL